MRETALTDFYARVIIDPTGRLNLLYLVKKPGEPAAPAPADASAPEVTTKRSLGGTTTTTQRPSLPVRRRSSISAQ